WGVLVHLRGYGLDGRWRLMCDCLTLEVRAAELIRTIDLFEDLSPEDLTQLCRAMRERSVRASEPVCPHGQPYDAMFIVAEGSVGVEGKRLGSGDVWGDRGLIAGNPGLCTATATVDTRLLELDRDSFEAVVMARPEAMRSVLAAVSRRAVQAN